MKGRGNPASLALSKGKTPVKAHQLKITCHLFNSLTIELNKVQIVVLREVMYGTISTRSHPRHARYPLALPANVINLP